jgi:hypothetical protein
MTGFRIFTIAAKVSKKTRGSSGTYEGLNNFLYYITPKEKERIRTAFIQFRKRVDDINYCWEGMDAKTIDDDLSRLEEYPMRLKLNSCCKQSMMDYFKGQYNTPLGKQIKAKLDHDKSMYKTRANRKHRRGDGSKRSWLDYKRYSYGEAIEMEDVVESIKRGDNIIFDNAGIDKQGNIFFNGSDGLKYDENGNNFVTFE